MVTIGALSHTTSAIVDLDPNGRLEHLTVEGGQTGSQAAAIILSNTLAGPRSIADCIVRAAREDIFVLSFAEATLTVERTLLEGGSTSDALFVAANASGTVTFRDSFLRQVGLSVFAPVTLNLEGNSIDVNFNSFSDLGPSSGSMTASIRGNRFFSSAGTCQQALILDRGTFTLAENRFTGLLNGCVAVRVNSASTALTLAGVTPDAPNVFSNNSIDLDVRAALTVEAQGVQWSNTSNPCVSMTLVAGASVVTDSGTCP